MPIRFACEHCDSTLSVSSRKAGHAVTCPKCRQKTPVPLPARQPAAATASSEVAPAAPQPRELPSPPSATPSLPPPVEETLVEPPPAPTAEPIAGDAAPSSEDDEVTWVYELDTERAPAGHDGGTIDFDRISLPRYVLYGQGVLLIGVALVALTLGILIGRGSAPREVATTGPAKPCYLTGLVEYKTSGGTAVPDRGAVVMVVPQDRRPSDKAPVEGLRPSDPLPADAQPALVALKLIGGDYARTDEQGYFKLRVPDTGDYFVLVLSRQAARKAGVRIDQVHLAQLGRYFQSAPGLIGDRQYRWRAESIQRDREFRFTFE